MNEIELILAKLKIVSEEKENGCYLCDKEHSKLLLNYINGLLKQLEAYENMRKEAIEYVKWQRDNPQYDNVWRNSECESLLNILNNVGGDNE